MTLTCSKCERLRPLDEFYRNRARRTGRDGYCKSCKRAYRRISLKRKRKRNRERSRIQYPRDKRCLYCKERKLAFEFCKLRSENDGLHFWCRSCTAVKRKARRAKERIEQREYYRKSLRRRLDIAKRSKKWRLKNPEKFRGYGRKHEQAKRAGGPFPFKEWKQLLSKYPCCPACGEVWGGTIRPTIDHVLPVSKGGTNSVDNLQPLCRSCNCRKHARIIKRYPLPRATGGDSL